ncbi:membrane protein [Streptomyces sulfonofaciens]|uniref:Membrane protein n=1 Tax=Streptomyces sulfonofaciens TaxID=68272 RepID=A0A919FPZ1_9ACTN|nr:membrane protein [Streptomyces sulfonofaciens]
MAASVSWLGLTLGLLALGVTAATTRSPAVAEASYRSMKVFADWLNIPIALLSLVSGVVLSLGTPWGLARHRWVLTKFWMTLAATGLTIFALRPEITRAAQQAVAGRQVTQASDLIVAPSVALVTYAFMTAISVLKPWGLTRRGRKLRISARKQVDVKALRPTA